MSLSLSMLLVSVFSSESGAIEFGYYFWYDMISICGSGIVLRHRDNLLFTQN